MVEKWDKADKKGYSNEREYSIKTKVYVVLGAIAAWSVIGAVFALDLLKNEISTRPII